MRTTRGRQRSTRKEERGDVVDLVIRNGLLVTPTGVVEAGIVVQDGRIAGIARNEDLPRAYTDLDAAGRYVVPGAIDSHCHMGQTDKRLAHLPDFTTAGNFASESRCALVGGTTTAANYALFSQGSLLEVLPEERAAVEAGSATDILFHGYLMNELHLSEYDRYVRELGLRTFKIFMPYRGQEALDLGGISSLNDHQMYRAFRMMAETPGGMAMIHAEDGDIVDACTAELKPSGRQDLAAWDASRPDYSEGDAVLRAIYLAQKADCPVCIVHVSSGEGVAAAEALRYPKSVLETCAHYLALHTDLPLGPLGKVCPPLRSPRHVDALWEAIDRGTVRFVGSDHNPWIREHKQELWGGLAGLPGVNMILPVLMTEGWYRRGLPLEKVVDLSSANAARALGLYPRKGAIQVGADADLVILETATRVRVTADMLQSCVNYTPYEGYEARAWPHATIVRGQLAYANGELRQVQPGRCLNQ